MMFPIKKFVWVFFALLLFATESFAGSFNHCAGEDGKKFFTDKPCPNQGISNKEAVSKKISKTRNTKSSPTKTYQEDEFFQLFLSLRNREMVKAQLGEPEAVNQFDNVTMWTYKHKVHSADGQVSNPIIHIVDGKPNLVNFVSPQEADEKILLANTRKKVLSQPAPKSKLYTVIEFESTFMNRRGEEVLKALGEPDSKNQVQGKETWKYNQIVKDAGKVWDQNIMFDFGRVNYIWSDRPSGGGPAAK